MKDFDPPIQSLGAVDVISKLKDGSVLLYIVCSGPLDDSLETLSRLEHKVKAYLAEIHTENFRRELGPAEGMAARIVIVCEYPISTLAAGMIKSLVLVAHAQGVELVHASSISSAVCW